MAALCTKPRSDEQKLLDLPCFDLDNMIELNGFKQDSVQSLLSDTLCIDFSRRIGGLMLVEDIALTNSVEYDITCNDCYKQYNNICNRYRDLSSTSVTIPNINIKSSTKLARSNRKRQSIDVLSSLDFLTKITDTPTAVQVGESKFVLSRSVTPRRRRQLEIDTAFNDAAGEEDLSGRPRKRQSPTKEKQSQSFSKSEQLLLSPMSAKLVMMASGSCFDDVAWMDKKISEYSGSGSSFDFMATTPVTKPSGDHRRSIDRWGPFSLNLLPLSPADHQHRANDKDNDYGLDVDGGKENVPARPTMSGKNVAVSATKQTTISTDRLTANKGKPRTPVADNRRAVDRGSVPSGSANTKLAKNINVATPSTVSRATTGGSSLSRLSTPRNPRAKSTALTPTTSLQTSSAVKASLDGSLVTSRGAVSESRRAKTPLSMTKSPSRILSITKKESRGVLSGTMKATPRRPF
jgi:hypothetical protein